MYKGYKIIALIPAKANSTRLPNKNIRHLLGKPLISYSIESALKSNLLDDIIISTDSQQIKDIASQYEVTILDRPRELCTPESHIKETLKHTVENVQTDFVLLMNPTSPLRASVDWFVQQFDPENYDCAASGYECKIYPWGSSDVSNQQQLRHFFYDDGNFYIHGKSYLDNYWPPDPKRRQAIITPKYTNFEIDDSVDFLLLETLMREFKGMLDS